MARLYKSDTTLESGDSPNKCGKCKADLSRDRDVQKKTGRFWVNCKGCRDKRTARRQRHRISQQVDLEADGEGLGTPPLGETDGGSHALGLGAGVRSGSKVLENGPMAPSTTLIAITETRRRRRDRVKVPRSCWAAELPPKLRERRCTVQRILP